MPQSIFTLLAQPPGNLAYHLVIAFSLAAALQATIVLPETPGFSRRRTLSGLGLLVAVQLVLFLISAFTQLGVFDAHIILPPADRAAGLLNLVWIVWLWDFPQRNPRIDLAAAVLSVLAFAYLAVAASLWASLGSGLLYSSTWLDLVANSLSALLAGLGIIWLLLHRRPGWGFGLAMLTLMLAGYLIQLSGTVPYSDFSGIIRLTQIVAFPLLISLPYRSLPLARPISPESARERLRYGADSETLRSLLALAGETDPDAAIRAAARSIGLAIRADSCMLLGIPGAAEEIPLLGGFDTIQDTPIAAASLNAASFPALAGALLHGDPLIWTRQSAPSEELAALKESTGLSNLAPLMLLPVKTQEKNPAGGILLLSSYSARAWSDEDSAYLALANDLVCRLIARVTAPVAAQGSEPRKDARTTWDVDTLAPLEPLPSPEPEVKVQPNTDLLADLSAHEELQQAILRLEAENERLRQTLFGEEEIYGDSHLENELQQSLVEVARLQNSLAESNAELLRIQQLLASSRLAPTRQAEVLASLVQEMRQPMASLAGYADLLLQETIGSLSVMQHKFLERIRVSVTRLQTLVDDLVQVAVQESGSETAPVQVLDLSTVIDQALAYNASLVREKNISLELELPTQMPCYEADGDALEQVLIHLLQNAAVATPNDGTVRLNVSIHPENGLLEVIRLQVTDSGGGIAAEDLPRVFSRLPRTTNISIPGVGDTGAGLSIAKTLVEAMGGRIWVDSQVGTSSTFHVTLPMGKRSQETFQTIRPGA